MRKSIDPNLVVAARDGDAQAFRILYEELAPSVYRAVLAMVKDVDEAEDVLQDCFVSVHAHLKGFRGDADIRTWVTRIAMNRARDSLRRHKHAPRSLDRIEQEGGRPLDHMSEMAQQPPPVADHGMERQLWAAIERLPDEFRTCFLLREVSDLSYEEIAESLKISVGTVRSRLFRAREQLRRRLDPLWKEAAPR